MPSPSQSGPASSPTPSLSPLAEPTEGGRLDSSAHEFRNARFHAMPEDLAAPGFLEEPDPWFRLPSPVSPIGSDASTERSSADASAEGSSAATSPAPAAYAFPPAGAADPDPPSLASLVATSEPDDGTPYDPRWGVIGGERRQQRQRSQSPPPCPPPPPPTPTPGTTAPPHTPITTQAWGGGVIGQQDEDGSRQLLHGLLLVVRSRPLPPEPLTTSTTTTTTTATPPTTSGRPYRHHHSRRSRVCPPRSQLLSSRPFPYNLYYYAETLSDEEPVAGPSVGRGHALFSPGMGSGLW
ncbi:eb876419-e161-4587-ae5e-fb92a96d71d5 [Thermothielavioides terrestris]|uniref:Uncharacterized protein n=2 Tax=Thermothielavioides terrestris TaxID=2587410 RepID=G2R9H3_THETT|nr:uncharacterized protein THITE_2131114 [Thermothielavioides terrestris NRRL 8126]AEO69517.1 hypothetical protein THITE_2131114 [Thermothielavioides terrestris NRRL 8126]SPQ26030.1 eb876419-e161-4587-ae5e-fb92a96d71d5 [Thermothielavioides terrestris]